MTVTPQQKILGNEKCARSFFAQTFWTPPRVRDIPAKFPGHPGFLSSKPKEAKVSRAGTKFFGHHPFAWKDARELLTRGIPQPISSWGLPEVRLTIPVGSAQGALDRGTPQLGIFLTEEFPSWGVPGYPRVVRIQGWFLAGPTDRERERERQLRTSLTNPLILRDSYVRYFFETPVTRAHTKGVMQPHAS